MFSGYSGLTGGHWWCHNPCHLSWLPLNQTYSSPNWTFILCLLQFRSPCMMSFVSILMSCTFISPLFLISHRCLPLGHAHWRQPAEWCARLGASWVENAAWVPVHLHSHSRCAGSQGRDHKGQHASIVPPCAQGGCKQTATAHSTHAAGHVHTHQTRLLTPWCSAGYRGTCWACQGSC